MAGVLSLPRGELKSVGLIAVGHGFSHFYMLILPPLFTLIRADLGVSWTDLGLLLAVFSVATGAAQLPAGILVDRIGGRPVLFAGLILQAAPFVLVALFPTYWGLMALVLIAGVGNAVFHPADYAILAAQVGTASARAARSGSTSSAGYAGWVVAPPMMLGLASVVDWPVAISVVGADRPPLRRLRRAPPRCARRRGDPGPAGGTGRKGRRRKPLCRRSGSSPRRRCCCSSCSSPRLRPGTAGIHAFAVVALVELYDASLAAANAQLTGYFAAAAVGVLIGGPHSRPGEGP